MYSDASFGDVADCAGRLGWMLIDTAIARVAGLGPDSVKIFTADVQETDLEFAAPRITQICLLELLPAWLAPFTSPAEFEHSDVIWFCDNEASASIMARGTSSSSDLAGVVAKAHLCWMRCDARVWTEWIDSKSNPSDGASREGVRDAFAAAIGVQVRSLKLPEIAQALRDVM